LVVADTAGKEGVRYRFLETVRQHAFERLADSNEHAALRHRHAAHFATLRKR
jgi:predicted ATPase